MWQSHMGWMMSNEAFHEQGSNSRDLFKYPELKFLQRHYVWILVLQMVGLFALGVLLSLVPRNWRHGLTVSGMGVLCEYCVFVARDIFSELSLSSMGTTRL